MRILWVTTKPPWPPTDGSRLLMQVTLDAVRAQGVDIHVLTPRPAGSRSEVDIPIPWRDRVAVVARSRWEQVGGLGGSLLRGEPWAIARHRSGNIAQAVARAIAGGGFDTVQVEQLQALPQCGAALVSGVPIVLRCHNVESELWTSLPGRAAFLGRIEGRRLARFEGRAAKTATAVVALSARDASHLDALIQRAAGGAGGAVETIKPPFPALLPAGGSLDGAPSLVLFGSAWHVNDDGLSWFLETVWPSLAQRLPSSRLHLFGVGPRTPAGAASAVRFHGVLADSRTAFADGSILLIPLRYGSGVRLRILEAWARGIAVVATSAAARGLDITPGYEACIADSPSQFRAAVERIANTPGLYRELVAAGRRKLARDHDPARIAAQLIAVHERTVARRGASAPPPSLATE